MRSKLCTPEGPSSQDEEAVLKGRAGTNMDSNFSCQPCIRSCDFSFACNQGHGSTIVLWHDLPASPAQTPTIDLSMLPTWASRMAWHLRGDIPY